MGEAYHSVLQISKILNWESMARMGVDGGGSLCAGGLIQEGHEGFGEGVQHFSGVSMGEGMYRGFPARFLINPVLDAKCGRDARDPSGSATIWDLCGRGIRLTERARE